MPHARLLAAILVLASAPSFAAEPRLVGYLPDYRASSFDPASARRLTDLIVFSAELSPDGSLDQSRLKSMPWDKLRQFKTEHRVRLLLCVGGWDRSAGFAAVAASAERRQRFAQQAVDACLKQRLDGIDLDWEHPKDEAEGKSYGELLATVKQAFRPHGLSLSVTMAAWQSLPRAAFAEVDSINVMAYDHDGQHATFEGAQRDIARLLEKGAPAEKLVLGVPLYGRHVTKRDQAITYAELLAKHKPAADVDEVDGYYFNGPTTLAKKARWVRDQKLAGIMVWELGQDAPGSSSLLKLLRETLGPRE